MEWHHMTCPMKTKFKSVLSAGTIMPTVLCDEISVNSCELAQGDSSEL
jgi:hypothetical protein